MDQHRLAVTYDLTSADRAAFVRYHTRHDPHMRRVLLLGYLAALILTPLGLWVAALRMGTENAWVVIPAGFFAVLVAFPLMLLSGRMFPTPRGEALRLEMEINPEGLVIRSHEGDSRMPWSSIRKVVGTPEHLFFFFTGMHGFAIPRRAFASALAADAFLGREVEYWEAARSGPPPAAAVPAETGPDGALVIQCQLTEADLAALQQHQIGRQLRNGKILLALAIFLGMGAMLGFLLGGAWAAVAGLLLMTLSWLLLFLRMNKKQLLSSAPELLAPHTLTFSTRGIAVENARGGKGTNLWSSIDRIETTSEYLLFQMRDGQSLAVPRRSFASTEAADEFLTTIEGWRTRYHA